MNDVIPADPSAFGWRPSETYQGFVLAAASQSAKTTESEPARSPLTWLFHDWRFGRSGDRRSVVGGPDVHRRVARGWWTTSA